MLIPEEAAPQKKQKKKPHHQNKLENKIAQLRKNEMGLLSLEIQAALKQMERWKVGVCNQKKNARTSFPCLGLLTPTCSWIFVFLRSPTRHPAQHLHQLGAVGGHVIGALRGLHLKGQMVELHQHTRNWVSEPHQMRQ